MSDAAVFPAGRLRKLAAAVPVWSLVIGLVTSVLAAALAIGIPLGGTESVLSRLSVVAFVVGMTALCLTGAALLQQDGVHPMGWWLIIAGLLGLLSPLVVGVVVAGVQSGVGLHPLLMWSSNWSWVAAQFAVLELMLRFPTGRLPGRAWRALEILVIAWAVWAVLVTALVPGPLGTEPLSHIENPIGWLAASDFLVAALTPTFVAIPVLMALTAGALLWRWFRGTASERQQLKWILAAALFLALVAPFAVLGDAPQLAEAVGYLLLPTAVAVAVLQHGLWDLGRAIRRSLIYAGATAVLAGCYLLVVLIIDDALAPIVAAVAIAALALPVKNFFQWMLERILFGQRGDPAKAVATLSAKLHRESPSLVHTVVEQLAHSLRLPFVAVENADGALLASAGVPGAEAARIALLVNGEQSGWLVAHERASGEGLGAKDRHLLQVVAMQAGLAVRAESLANDLRTSYARLASVREEERARLQRDLHDQLGPSLAGIVMQSEAARNLARSTSVAEDARLDAVLESIGRNAESMVRDVRRIVDDLGSTSLESGGLGFAIKEAAGRLAPDRELHLDMPDRIPGLAPQVELAVFRVTLEAVLNATRHAGAETIWARITGADHLLTIEVEDDGVGMGTSQPGVGMRSMRDRIESLGGSFTVGAGRHGRGTRVVAEIRDEPR